MSPDLVIFDGDDTLWISEPLYDRARSEAAELVRLSGIDPAEFESLQQEIDLENFKSLGLSSERFPLSCRQAYEHLAGPNKQMSIASQVESAAASVFSNVAEPVDSAADVVEYFAKRCTTVLLTKGDRRVQAQRIEDSGLRDFFDEVVIVDSKDAQTFRTLVEKYLSAESWSIGNSYRSDILPAVEAGCFGVWIDAHVWALEAQIESVESHQRIQRLDKIEYVVPLHERVESVKSSGLGV